MAGVSLKLNSLHGHITYIGTSSITKLKFHVTQQLVER